MYRSGFGTINSLRTGSGVWLIVFDKKECDGCALKVGPNVKKADLDGTDRCDLDGNKKGDWKNQIASFLMYTEKPAFWDTEYPRPYVDFSTLFSLYPATINSDSDDKITYVIEDATYNIDEPELSVQSTTRVIDNYYGNDDMSALPEDGWTRYNVSISHDNTGGRNDKATFQIYFDNSGKLVSIQYFNWTSNGAYNISQALISIVDDEAWLLGTIGALETLGISEEAADAFVQVFDFVTTVFNDISTLVYKKTDNGGSYYFLPVICHTINRICTTVIDNYGLASYSQDGDPRNNYQLDFDYSDYLNRLIGADSNVTSATDWAAKSGANGSAPYNEVVEFVYQDYAYRTWYQEASYSNQLGIIVSCKIDYEIADNKDDHIILLMGFSTPQDAGAAPILGFAQATIQFTDMSNSNIMTDTCTGNDIINEVYSQLSAKLSGVSTDGGAGGRIYLADIAKANLQAIAECAVFVEK